MADQLVMHLRSLVRLNQYVTQDEYHFLTRFGGLLKKVSGNIAIFHPLYGAGKLEDLLASYRTFREGTGYPPKPNITLKESEEAIEVARPKGFRESTVEKFLVSALRDDPRDEQFFYIILDADRYLGDENFQALIREFAFQSLQDIRCIKNLYLVTPTDETPPRLARYVSKIKDPGLDLKEVKEWLAEFAKYLSIQPPQNVEAYVGFTLYELHEVCSVCVITTKESGRSLYHEGVITEYRKMRGLPVSKGIAN